MRQCLSEALPEGTQQPPCSRTLSCEQKGSRTVPGQSKSRTVPGQVTGWAQGCLPASQTKRRRGWSSLFSCPVCLGGALLQRTACALPRGRVTDLKKPGRLPRSCLHRTPHVRRKSHIEQVLAFGLPDRLSGEPESRAGSACSGHASKSVPGEKLRAESTRPHTLNKKTLVSAGDKDWMKLSGMGTHQAEISLKNGLDKVRQNGHIDAKQTPD